MGSKSSIVGYGFHPNAQELINHYLRKKRLDPDFSVKKIIEVNLYDYEPSELPGLLPVEADEEDWHFFCEPDYKYGKSKRVNRRTRGGNWKVTGKKRFIKDNRKRVIGWKITLVFYLGSGNSKEARTNWVMHEYHINPDSSFKKEFVLVRIKRNPNNKHVAPATPNGGVSSPDMASNSGSHNPEDDVLQDENQHQQQPQPLAKQGIPFQRTSQLLPNRSISKTRDTEKLADRILNGNSLLNQSEREDDGRNSQSTARNEFHGQEIGPSHPTAFNSSKAVTGASVYYGSDEAAINAMLNDGSLETIQALLNEFSSMANEECDFNSISMCQPQCYLPVPDEKSLPAPTW